MCSIVLDYRYKLFRELEKKPHFVSKWKWYTPCPASVLPPWFHLPNAAALRCINTPRASRLQTRPLRYTSHHFFFFPAKLSRALAFCLWAMASLTDLVNLNLSDCTDSIIAEYIWLVSLCSCSWNVPRVQGWRLRHRPQISDAIFSVQGWRLRHRPQEQSEGAWFSSRHAFLNCYYISYVSHRCVAGADGERPHHQCEPAPKMELRWLQHRAGSRRGQRSHPLVWSSSPCYFVPFFPA